MIRRLRLHAVRRDEGAILLFALIIITTIALVVGAVLTRGDGSLRATVALRSVAGSSYAADAAANVAINNLRTGYGFSGNPNESGFNNSLDGTGCFGNNVGVGGTDQLKLDGFYPPTGSVGPSSALVECTGESGTGMQSSPVPINNTNKPGYAIVTLNGPIETSDPLKVHGGVYANGDVTGAVNVDAGGLWASGSCTQAVATPKSCNTGAKIADPNYTNDLGGAVPALQIPPTSCTSGVAVFQPGYYDDVKALNTATTLCSVAWFQPGAYYFDFHNETCTNVCPTAVFNNQANVWNIAGATVVGGTPTNASGTVISRPSTNPTMPGACQSPITDTTAVGVQFVFGGSSRMYVDNNSHVELCGSYHSNRPPIELYGLKSGTTPTSSSSNGLAVTGVGATTSSNASWGSTLTSANLAAGGGTASWTTSSASAQTTTVTATGFTGSLPAGSILTAATVHIAHQDAENKASSNGAAVLTVGGVSTASQTIAASAASAAGVVTTDWSLSGADLANLQKQIHTNGYSGATMAYTAAASRNNATAKLDSITLDLTYYAPVLRGETDAGVGICNVSTGTVCPLLDMKNGNNKILFYLQGTTYTPSAYLSVLLGNFAAEIAKFGVVARQLHFEITNGNPSWTGPIFEIPDNSPGYGFANTTIDLTIHLCPNRPSGCTKADPVALTSRVQLWDDSGAPAPPGRQVSVLSWSHQR